METESEGEGLKIVIGEDKKAILWKKKKPFLYPKCYLLNESQGNQ